MKNNFKTLMTGMVLLATCAVGNAQNTDNRGFGGGQMGEQSVETRGNAIAKELGLDASTTKKFLSVYKKEQSAMQELMPSRGQRPEGNPPSDKRPQGNPPQGAPGDMGQGGRRPQGNPPSGDFQQNETNRNNNSSSRRRGPQMSEETRKKMEEVQTKYKKQYGKFLSEEQIQKVYQHQGGPQNGQRRQNNGNSTGTK